MVKIPMIFDSVFKVIYIMPNFYAAWSLFESDVVRYKIYISETGEYNFE